MFYLLCFCLETSSRQLASPQPSLLRDHSPILWVVQWLKTVFHMFYLFPFYLKWQDESAPPYSIMSKRGSSYNCFPPHFPNVHCEWLLLVCNFRNDICHWQNFVFTCFQVKIFKNKFRAVTFRPFYSPATPLNNHFISFRWILSVSRVFWSSLMQEDSSAKILEMAFKAKILWSTNALIP